MLVENQTWHFKLYENIYSFKSLFWFWSTFISTLTLWFQITLYFTYSQMKALFFHCNYVFISSPSLFFLHYYRTLSALSLPIQNLTTSHTRKPTQPMENMTDHNDENSEVSSGVNRRQREVAEGPNDIVLVTGGSGFLGQHIVYLLQTRAPHVKEIRILDLHAYRNMLSVCSNFLTFLTL